MIDRSDPSMVSGVLRETCPECYGSMKMLEAEIHTNRRTISALQIAMAELSLELGQLKKATITIPNSITNKFEK